jgi:hypothetical protein
MPAFLYHATPKKNVREILITGLEPRSFDVKKQTKHLSMAEKEGNARSLAGHPDDIVFRVAFRDLTAGLWKRLDTGEWQGTETIVPNLLEYRRLFGTPKQKTWQPVANYPAGMS